MNEEKNRTNENFCSNFFKKAISSNKLCQSYLLVKISNEFLLKLSQDLAAQLNCTVDPENYCGKCFNCKSILSGTHPKTPIYISGEGQKNIIKVEKIRELQTELTQSSEYFRIIVIKDASSKSLAKFAATALLKTIEEVKNRTLFLFAAQSKDEVLNTISSRCQTLYVQNNEESFNEPSELSQNYFIKDLNKSRLEQLLLAETLAQHENDELIVLLKSWQNELAQDYSLINSRLIEKIDLAILDLRNFIRPVALLQNLLKEIAIPSL